MATCMEILDTPVVNVSIPHLAGNMGATVEEGTWVVTSSLGFGMLQVVLDTGQRKDWFGSTQIRIRSALCIFGLVALVVRELKTEHPIVDLRVLKDRTFTAGVIIMTMLGFVRYGSLLRLPIFLQTLLAYPALQSGLALSSRGLGSLVMMPITG